MDTGRERAQGFSQEVAVLSRAENLPVSEDGEPHDCVQEAENYYII